MNYRPDLENIEDTHDRCCDESHPCPDCANDLIQRSLSMLERFEWVPTVDSYVECICCGAFVPYKNRIHNDGCELAALIQELKNG